MSRSQWLSVEPPAPLSSTERGQGCWMPSERIAELERYCADVLRAGGSQKWISETLHASRSRISRWSIAGLRKHGSNTDHRLLHGGRASLSQMMWARIEVAAPDECWAWRGAIKPNGYGALNFHGKGYNAHRLVFETLVGELGPGLVVDHKCRNKRCVNPAHLQAAGQGLNVTLASVRAAA